MNDKPVLLLDVDGVLNACTGLTPSVWPAESWNKGVAFANGAGWSIKWATEVAEFIRNIYDKVDIRWHTTWQHEAEAIAELLNLPRGLPVAEAPEFYAKSGYGFPPPTFYWWKMGAALRVLNDEGRSLIWLDDDLGEDEIDFFYDETSRWNGALETLLIRPRTFEGLSPNHLQEIETFVEKTSGGSRTLASD